MDVEWSIFLGFGSMHDLRDAESPDPRNPRLAGFRSVSYAAAVAMAPKPAKKPAARRIGFDTRSHLRGRK